MSNVQIQPEKPAPAAPVAPVAPVVPANHIEADLDVLIQSGVIERTVEPFPGYKVTMHTLLNHERLEVSKQIPNEQVMTAAAAEHAPKEPTLVQAITCIEKGENKYFFDKPETKPTLQAFLHRMSGVMIDMLYIEYLKMTSDMITIIETGVKKN